MKEIDRSRPHRLVAAVLCLLAPSLLCPQTDQRVALVIGNGTYRHAPLEHPPREATAMAQALQECGFGVIKRINCNHQQMEAAIREFGAEIQRGGVGLFYYGGHGLQVEGRNYLIPIGADIRGEEEVKFKAVDAGMVLAKMKMAGNRVNLMILDACRNNPYQSSFMSPTRGLLKMDAPTGTLLAYSTAPGNVAVDGVYTPALIEQMTTPGLPLSQVFINTRIEVMAKTGDSQVPWESTSLTRDFPFVAAGEYDRQIEELQQELDTLHQLVEDGRVRPGLLGARINDLSLLAAEALGMENTQGVLVEDLVDGGPASEAGLKRGDVVLAMDGIATASATELQSRIGAAEPGTVVELLILRKGREKTIDVELGQLGSDSLLVEDGKVRRALLGAYIYDLSPQAAEALGMENTQGVLVGNLVDDGPASEAGLKRGDVVLAMDGIATASATELQSRIGAAEPGTKVELLILRKGKEKTIEVELGQLASDSFPPQHALARTEGKLGLTVQELTPEVADPLGYEGESGALVAAVAEGSEAARRGLRRGDLILEINSWSVETAEDYDEALAKVEPGQAVLMLVRRGTNTSYVGLRMLVE